jgi:hypothetical protein
MWLMGAHAARAEVDRFPDPVCGDTPCTLADVLVRVLNALIYILFPIIVLMIVYTGFLFIAAQGKPPKIVEARRALMWAVIGALVVLGSKALALAIGATVASLQA